MGKRVTKCSTYASTSRSTDVEAADHKGSVPLQKAEKKLKKKSESKQIDLEPKKKSTSKNIIKEMKKWRKSFKEMTETMKKLEEVFMLRADPPPEKPRKKKKKLATHECNFETKDSDGNNRDSVLVYNLDTSLSRNEIKTALRKQFESCGCKVTRVYVPIECLTGVPLGIAFVNVDDKVKAVRQVSRRMGDRMIIVFLAENQPDCSQLPNFRGCRRCCIIRIKRRRKRFLSTPRHKRGKYF